MPEKPTDETPEDASGAGTGREREEPSTGRAGGPDELDGEGSPEADDSDPFDVADERDASEETTDTTSVRLPPAPPPDSDDDVSPFDVADPEVSSAAAAAVGGDGSTAMTLAESERDSEGPHAGSPFDAAPGAPEAPGDLTAMTMAEPVGSDAGSHATLPVARASPAEGRPAVEAAPRSAGSVLKALARAFVYEFDYPRRRVRHILEFAQRRMRKRPAVWAAVLGFLAGALFLLYSSSPSRGAALDGAEVFWIWAVFMGVFVFLVIGLPALLAYSWPVLAVAVAAPALWASFALPQGIGWLVVATGALALAFYVSATGVVPFVVASVVGLIALRGGWIPGAVAFAGTLFVMTKLRKHLTGPILSALWVYSSASLAAWASWGYARDSFPDEWMTGTGPGPVSLVLWKTVAVVVVLVLLGPSTRAMARTLEGLDSAEGEE